MTLCPDRSLSEAMLKCGWIPAGPLSWTTSLTNGAALPVSARLEDPWLRVEARIPEPRETSWWRLLVTARSLPPLVRLALASAPDRAMSVLLVADLEDGERPDWPSRVGAVSEELIVAVTRLGHSGFDDCEPEPESQPPESLSDAIREAGWACEDRGEGRIDVSLEGDRTRATARVEPRGGGLCLWTPVARSVRSNDEDRTNAVALFLLHTAHRLRAVRAVARHERGKQEAAVGWEARLPLEPESGEIDRALSALTVACQLSAREVEALSTPALSCHYLTQRGARSHGRAPLAKAPRSR